MRIIFVPQYPAPMRYQEWWFWKFPQEFANAGFEVKVLESNLKKIKKSDAAMFSPINAAIEFETQQIKEYMNLELKNDDILFMSDISFPGFFPNVLFHKKPKKVFGFCHATSLNKLDYFEKMREYKFPVEKSTIQICDKVFVGSKYHENKLKIWKKTEVTYLPYPPISARYYSNQKTNDIVSASRPSLQKVDSGLENLVEEKFGKIKRPPTPMYHWSEYYLFLSSAKVLLITAHEDTFGYQIVDAVLNGCIPIARNSLAYPEILPQEYLYNNKEELFTILEKALGGELEVPHIICDHYMKNFYKNIINVMQGGDEYPF